jgi:hypothetical protein
MPAGRKPMSIADQVDRLAGSSVAKTRLRVILANLAGQLSIAEACAQLGIEQSRFFALKRETLESWVQTMEPGSPGRHPAVDRTPEQRQIAELEQRVARVELELQAAQVREELARQGLFRPTEDRKHAAKKAQR